MVADRVRSQGTLADASPDSTITSNVNAGLDFVDESVARLQSLDGVLDAQQTPGNDSPTFGLFCRFHPNGIIRVTQAAGREYQDVHSSIERLLDSEGFLTALSPLQQRRKVWEAWKHSHGLGFLEYSKAVPYGVEPDAVILIQLAEHIPKVRPSSRRDTYAQEAVDLVDQLFDTECCLRRAVLLGRIALTFVGILTTSLRQQLVDVLGSHLIGLDHQPGVGYTGRNLTIQEQVAAADAIRRTSSPHSFYYLEKFLENSGRSYLYNVDGVTKHRRTTAVVRAAVVRAVEGMLDDVERNSYYSSRTDTWKMREYATDIGNLRRRLSELNWHLYTDANTSLTLARPLPLPSSADRYHIVSRRLWRKLTAVSDEQLTALSQVLARFDHHQTNSPPDGINYVARTRGMLDRIRAVPEIHWLDLQQQLAAVADLRSCALAISRFREEYSDQLRGDESGRLPVRTDREINIWGRAQESELANLRLYAEILLTKAQDAPAEMSQEQAVDAIAAVLLRRRAVANPYHVYQSDLAGGRQRQASGSPLAAAAKLRDRVEQAGGPAVYYQISCRPESDPNRVLFEIALVVLALIAQSPSPTIRSVAKTRAQQHLAEYRDRGIAWVLDSWCGSSLTPRVRVQKLQEIHLTLLEFDRPGHAVKDLL